MIAAPKAIPVIAFSEVGVSITLDCPKIFSKPIAFYIFLVRGTPLLVQIYLIYFGLGSIKPIRESFLCVPIIRLSF